MFTISKGFAVISATKNLQLPFIEDIFASRRTRFLEWVVSENQVIQLCIHSRRDPLRVKQRGTTSVARKGKSQDRASGTAHPQSSRLSLDRHISNESSHDKEMQETCSIVGIKKGRGKAKGKDGNGNPIVIRRGRIITTGAVRTIGVPFFYQAIDGAWPTFKTFPSTQMDLLYDRFNATGYTHTCSEEEMREAFEEHIKLRYSDWMSSLRNSVFKKYKTTGDRYTHCPLGISQDVWSKLVNHWLQPTWQDKSKRNKSNRAKSTIVHTTGSVPMEKYRKDELD